MYSENSGYEEGRTSPRRADNGGIEKCGLFITKAGRRVHVTFTLRDGNTLIRVISARDMHRKEREVYDQET